MVLMTVETQLELFSGQLEIIVLNSRKLNAGVKVSISIHKVCDE